MFHEALMNIHVFSISVSQILVSLNSVFNIKQGYTYPHYFVKVFASAYQGSTCFATLLFSARNHV